LFVLTPISGILVDRYGRLIVATPFVVLLLIAPIPLFEWLSYTRTIGFLCVAQLALATIMSGYLGALSALLADLFPVRSRTTGISLGYNMSVLLFGGFAPFIMTWLAVKTGSVAVPGYYLAAGAACSLVAIAAAWRRGYR
jgi:MFS transporter, MHS family, proline/betaine transporter